MSSESNHLVHGLALMDQGRYDLAAERLRSAIGEDPDDGDLFALLATCLLHGEKLKDAEAAARRAIELQADDSQNLATLAIILQRRNKAAEAIDIAKRSVAQAPSSAYAWTALSAAYSGANKWSDALEAAENGLVVDADDGNLRAIRTTALTKLGRATAVEDARAALAEDPECEVAHNNLAFALLRSGRQEEAVTHFREALRIDPNFTGAREGLLEAMKGRSLVYRPILALYQAANRFTAGQQLIALCVLFGTMMLLKRVIGQSSPLTPYFTVADSLLVAAMLFIGFGDALVSLVMRFDPVGRYALTQRQSRFALAVGALTVPLIVAMFGSVFSVDPFWTRLKLVVFPYVGALVVLMEVAQPRQVRAANLVLTVGAVLGVLYGIDRLVLLLGLGVLWNPYLYITLFGAVAVWLWQTFGEADV